MPRWILRRNLIGGLEDDAPTPGQKGVSAILDYAAGDDFESCTASTGAVPCQPGAKGNKEAVARVYGYASEQQCDRLTGVENKRGQTDLLLAHPVSHPHEVGGLLGAQFNASHPCGCLEGRTLATHWSCQSSLMK